MSWADPIRRAFRRVDVRVAATLALMLAPLIGALIFLYFAYATLEAMEEIDRRARRRGMTRSAYIVTAALAAKEGRPRAGETGRRRHDAPRGRKRS